MRSTGITVAVLLAAGLQLATPAGGVPGDRAFPR